jgi:hypothetical protein
MRSHVLATLAALLARGGAFNFPFESIQLSEVDISNFPAIGFGDKSKVSAVYDGPTCKAMPGTDIWPVDEEWAQLNSSMGGALLKPVPPAAACYPGPNLNAAMCTYLMSGAFNSRYYIDDPLTILTSWPQGNTCPLTRTPRGQTCTQGGFPVYVVNATTVQHIQAGVNFARNKTLRLVIK